MGIPQGQIYFLVNRSILVLRFAFFPGLDKSSFPESPIATVRHGERLLRSDFNPSSRGESVVEMLS